MIEVTGTVARGAEANVAGGVATVGETGSRREPSGAAS
jgi:hypothetical protein